MTSNLGAEYIIKLENDEKNVKNFIHNIDDSTLYRLLSETPY